jgi:peptidoglycan/LPS O-acetylase OafA/YrhL
MVFVNHCASLTGRGGSTEGRPLTLWVLVVAGPVAYSVGLASWRIVERPALQLKPRPHGRLARLTASAARL